MQSLYVAMAHVLALLFFLMHFVCPPVWSLAEQKRARDSQDTMINTEVGPCQSDGEPSWFGNLASQTPVALLDTRIDLPSVRVDRKLLLVHR